MKIEIELKQKEKFVEKLSLSNFSKEVIQEMYNNTVVQFSKRDLSFHVLVFFLSLRDEKNSLLYKLLEENLPKLNDLNKKFAQTERKLKKDEYHKYVREVELDGVLKFDILFLLIGCMLDSNKYRIDFKDFFQENSELLIEFNKIDKLFSPDVLFFSQNFRDFKIEDDRYDDKGEYHDLAKSVYRPVQMRINRKSNRFLQQNTEVRILKSQSPVVLNVVQQIDPQITVHIWNSYNLYSFIQPQGISIWNVLGGLGGVAAIGSLALQWLSYKSQNGQSHKEKRAEKKKLQKVQKLPKVVKSSELLNKPLIDAILKTDKSRKIKIKKLKVKLSRLEQKHTLNLLNESEKKMRKTIINELKKLQNLIIKAKKID
ncbi:MAG: hypothetical protein WC304_00180 [Candidatus Gracilibacteria bacterium]|jgi:hypothetical protein